MHRSKLKHIYNKYRTEDTGQTPKSKETFV